MALIEILMDTNAYVEFKRGNQQEIKGVRLELILKNKYDSNHRTLCKL